MNRTQQNCDIKPGYLFSSDNFQIGELYEKLQHAERIILFLDYDGTLVPICRTPREAVLSADMKNVLQDLSSCSKIQLVFVTGRSHSDIKNMIGLENAVYASNHGFQISNGKQNWVHPEAEEISQSLADVAGKLKTLLDSFSMTIIENKTITLSVHYRQEEKKNVPAVKNIVSSELKNNSAKFKMTRGKKVIEIRPRVSWNKGMASVKILASLNHDCLNNSFIMYIGDDRTDEDAFAALSDRALTVRVGKGVRTHAHYYVHDAEEVKKLLLLLSGLTAESRSKKSRI